MQHRLSTFVAAVVLLLVWALPRPAAALPLEAAGAPALTVRVVQALDGLWQVPWGWWSALWAKDGGDMDPDGAPKSAATGAPAGEGERPARPAPPRAQTR